MSVAVLDFYQRKKNNKFPNKYVYRDPVFYILAKVNGRLKELALKLAGDIKPPSTVGLKDFEEEAYICYTIIVNAFLSDSGEAIRVSWGLSERDFKDLIFDMYCVLVSKYSKCGFIKRFLLYFSGVCKFYFGGK